MKLPLLVAGTFDRMPGHPENLQRFVINAEITVIVTSLDSQHIEYTDEAERAEREEYIHSGPSGALDEPFDTGNAVDMIPGVELDSTVWGTEPETDTELEDATLSGGSPAEEPGPDDVGMKVTQFIADAG